jgi:hypothetical protein
MHPEPGRDVQDLAGHEDSSAARPRMQSSRPEGESSSTQPPKQDSGQPEDAEAAQPEDARFGATRRSIDGAAEGAKMRGNPEIRHRRRWKIEESGKPEASTPGTLEGARSGETRRAISQQR